jgi:hypothetical protein
MPGNIPVLDVSRYICAFDEIGRKIGLHFAMGDDFEEYLDITSRIPGKSATYPNFRPECSNLGGGRAFWIIGRDKSGGLAHVQALRIDDLGKGNLAEHLESLRACYADPKLQAGPGSTCKCYAPAARGISRKVVYHGDLWLRKDFRGLSMPGTLARIAFGLAWAKWAPDFIYALVPDWLVKKGIVEQYGYAHRELHGSILNLPEEGVEDDDWLIWLTRDEVARLISRTADARLAAATAW